MSPVPGMVEKKALDSIWPAIRKAWSWHTDVVKQLHDMTKERNDLVARLDKAAAFERKLAQYKCSPDDDNIYWSIDESGQGICPYCINATDPLFTPLTRGSEGYFYCKLHDHYFETNERRQLDAQRRHPQARSRQATGPNAWMLK